VSTRFRIDRGNAGVACLPHPAPWLPRAERAFVRLAAFVQTQLDMSAQDALTRCLSDAAAPARAQVLASPSAVLALEDAGAWLQEVLSPAARGTRAEWRRTSSFDDATARIGTLVQLIDTLDRGAGSVRMPALPCSLPGLDVRVEGEGDGDGDGDTVSLRRERRQWICDSGHTLHAIERVPFFGADVRVDSHAPWLGEVRRRLHWRPTATWSWGDTPRQATALLERALGEAGAELPSLVSTLVPFGATDDETFSSFSSAVAPGALYLTATSRPEMLAELIIHEAGHTWLNVQDERGAVLEEDAGDLLLASPFRGTDRPIMGLVHGVVSFGWIRRYWQGLMDAGISEYAETAEARLMRVTAQIDEAILTLKATGSAVTSHGWELIETAARPSRD